MTLVSIGLTVLGYYSSGETMLNIACYAKMSTQFRRHLLLRYRKMNWNDAAEDLLNAILAQTPRPERDATADQLRAIAEAIAEEDGKNRVGVETVIAAWVRHTPEALRPDL